MNAGRVIVVGGGGALGSAVVEQLLASHRFDAVGVLAHGSLQPALRRLVVVNDSSEAIAHFRAATALVVFDRLRHANGREAAFVHPEPEALVVRARQLHDAGVTRLIIVVPHAPALLPRALLEGLASLDEAAVAAMGFEQLVLMRMAQSARSGGDAAALPGFGHRLARALLAQLHWLVPQRDQPVRATAVARTAASLAVAAANGGQSQAASVRVLPPQLPWLVAQGMDADLLVADWWLGKALPAAPPGKAAQRW